MIKKLTAGALVLASSLFASGEVNVYSQRHYDSDKILLKQFESEITVANLDGTGKPANGRSLMKVVALGVKKGHRLRFTAQGADAEQALKAIGDAIAAGLGEGA